MENGSLDLVLKLSKIILLYNKNSYYYITIETQKTTYYENGHSRIG